MKEAEVREFLHGLWGDRTMVLFNNGMEDMLCCARLWALTDVRSSEEEVKDKLVNIAHGIIVECTKAYLIECYGTKEDGGPRTNVTEDEIYDENMRPIPAVVQLRRHKIEIVRCMMDESMRVFRQGCDLARQIVARTQAYKSNKLVRRHDCPMELVEVEIMRLERKLPLLSDEEGRRLTELYKLVGAGTCAGTS